MTPKIRTTQGVLDLVNPERGFICDLCSSPDVKIVGKTTTSSEDDFDIVECARCKNRTLRGWEVTYCFRKLK